MKAREIAAKALAEIALNLAKKAVLKSFAKAAHGIRSLLLHDPHNMLYRSN